MDHPTRGDDFTPLPSSLAPLRPAEEVLTPIEVPPRRKGWPLLAWVIILAVSGYIVYRNMERYRTLEGQVGGEAGGAEATFLVTAEIQGRYLVGAASLFEKLNNPAAGAAGPKMKQDMLAAAKKSMDKGIYPQRLRYAVIAGELDSPAKAREELARLEDDRRGGLDAPKRSVEAARLLDRLYKGYEKDPKQPTVTLGEEEQQRLRSGLRWFGDLALAPPGGDPQEREAALAPARRTAVALLLFSSAIVAGLLVGFVLLVAAVALAYAGKLRPGLVTGSGHGGVYAEAFALYMLLYFGLSATAGYLIPPPYTGPVLLAVMFLSLMALGWPVLRGISWRQVREDVGLSFAGKPLLNLSLGLVTWVAALPLVGVGLAVMYGLTRLLGIDLNQPGQGPSHPIVGVVLQKEWWVWLLVFVMAAVGAPIVEEIMFRGLLYRHLREATRSFRVGVSVTLSVLASAFLFAVIHPQGWLGVPLLMALAVPFALAREWRQSLAPSMVAHALNNGLITLLLFTMTQ